MTKPDAKVEAGVYTFTWEKQGIVIQVDRVTDEKRGVAGEIMVRTTAPGFPSHLSHSRMSLTSASGKETLARTLERRMSDQGWTDKLESVCVATLAHFRKGEPVIRLRDHETSEALKFRLAPIIPEGKATLIYAEGSSGKSTLASYFAISVAANTNGPFTAEPGNVLYLDYETDADEANERAFMISRGLGLEDIPPNFYYRYCHQAIADDVIEIQRIVHEHQIQLLVFDSAAPACGGDPEKTDLTLGFFNAVRGLRTTALITAHISKEAMKSGKTAKLGPFGSMFWMNIPRAVYEIRRKEQEPGSPVLEVGVFNRKMNTDTLAKPLGLRLEYTSNDVKFTKIDVKTVAELSEALPVKARMQNLLETKGAMSPNDIADTLGERVDTVRKTALRHQDTFVKVGDDWGVLTRDRH